MAFLGVNIDHVATVRQARRGSNPDPIWAAVAAELGGADGITVHLREDRRHINDRDVRMLSESVHVPLNLEMATDPEITRLACELKPYQVTLVPERREEITTEGGLNLVSHTEQLEKVIGELHHSGVIVSLFLDPDVRQIKRAAALGADAVELHTGAYSLAAGSAACEELERLASAGKEVRALGMTLHAGHGLNYYNVVPVSKIEDMRDLNIGHSIVSRAIMIGMEAAVREMKELIRA